MKHCCFLLILFLFSCSNESNISDEDHKNAFHSVMQKHLDAVSNKDIDALASTMSPDGNMQLILPSAEIMDSVTNFINFHAEWFKDTSWTFETEILNSRIGNEVGMAIVEIIYREPERDGQPYFNRMIVSYDLAFIDGKWRIIKDHASSIEKSTD